MSSPRFTRVAGISPRGWEARRLEGLPGSGDLPRTGATPLLAPAGNWREGKGQAMKLPGLGSSRLECPRAQGVWIPVLAPAADGTLWNGE